MKTQYSKLISRYLDSDKRLNASIVTPSSANFEVIEKTTDDLSRMCRTPTVFFWGVLGCIESSVAGRYDFPIAQGPNKFLSISLLDFERTIRGITTGEFYHSMTEPKAYRFFFKRSVNQAQSSKAIPIKFTLNLH